MFSYDKYLIAKLIQTLFDDLCPCKIRFNGEKMILT